MCPVKEALLEVSALQTDVMSVSASVSKSGSQLSLHIRGKDLEQKTLMFRAKKTERPQTYVISTAVTKKIQIK